MMRCHLTGNEAAQAVSMLQAGQVQRAVAGHFNVSQSVISRLKTTKNCIQFLSNSNGRSFLFDNNLIITDFIQLFFILFTWCLGWQSGQDH
jgi:hypothetical protein